METTAKCFLFRTLPGSKQGFGRNLKVLLAEKTHGVSFYSSISACFKYLHSTVEHALIIRNPCLMTCLGLGRISKWTKWSISCNCVYHLGIFNVTNVLSLWPSIAVEPKYSKLTKCCCCRLHSSLQYHWLLSRGKIYVSILGLPSGESDLSLNKDCRVNFWIYIFF